MIQWILTRRSPSEHHPPTSWNQIYHNRLVLCFIGEYLPILCSLYQPNRPQSVSPFLVRQNHGWFPPLHQGLPIHPHLRCFTSPLLHLHFFLDRIHFPSFSQICSRRWCPSYPSSWAQFGKVGKHKILLFLSNNCWVSGCFWWIFPVLHLPEECALHSDLHIIAGAHLNVVEPRRSEDFFRPDKWHDIFTTHVHKRRSAWFSPQQDLPKESWPPSSAMEWEVILLSFLDTVGHFAARWRTGRLLLASPAWHLASLCPVSQCCQSITDLWAFPDRNQPDVVPDFVRSSVFLELTSIQSMCYQEVHHKCRSAPVPQWIPRGEGCHQPMCRKSPRGQGVTGSWSQTELLHVRIPARGLTDQDHQPQGSAPVRNRKDGANSIK